MDQHGSGASGRFPLGRIVATPGVLTALEQAGHTPLEFIVRHAVGDWGEVDDHDRQENELSLVRGFRLLSAYSSRTALEYGSSPKPIVV